eukprot:6208640-Pleurochrysis_carterae.AAC.2
MRARRSVVHAYPIADTERVWVCVRLPCATFGTLVPAVRLCRRVHARACIVVRPCVGVPVFLCVSVCACACVSVCACVRRRAWARASVGGWVWLF